MPCYDVEASGGAITDTPPCQSGAGTPTIALAGNPNAGKTSLFNVFTGLRTKTANFAGTTVEHISGRMKLGERDVNVIDLPGMYSLQAVTPDEEVAQKVLLGEWPGMERPDAVVLMADASNLERSLFLISQVIEHGVNVVVALNMMDVAHREGIQVDPAALSRELGCPVVPTVARTGQGADELKNELSRLVHESSLEGFTFETTISGCSSCSTCPFESRYSWTENVASRCAHVPHSARSVRTEKIDEVLTHPVVGVAAFLAVMLGVFYLIFSVATVPMDLIDGLFAQAGSLTELVLPDGDFRSLIVDGVIGGVGGILVFLPQICILFFFLALLEDSGYLARAAFVMDRLMGRIGLPGTAFVPLISAHACAIPAIMATRVIRDPRDRLVTILVAPLMTCSARIPVYAMLTALLFPSDPARAALVFVGAYGLGIVAALGMAFVFKRTILPGESKPLVLELPSYRLPSLRSSFLYTWDRARVFIQQAGTIILAISVILWALATYPRSEVPAEIVDLQDQAEVLVGQGRHEQAQVIATDAENQARRYALAQSFAGRLGHLIEPVVEPLGFDWQIGIGIVSSFAAREVIVSTLSIVYGLGDDASEDDENGLYNTLRKATRVDGTPVFTTATSLSLLVFYVLAMQCLPTQAVTKRETGSWKWAAFQLGYMTLLAYGASFIAFQLAQQFQS